MDKRIRFVSDKNDEEIRDIKDGKLDITELVTALNLYKDTILKINYKADERTVFTLKDSKISISEALSGFNVEQLTF